MMADPQTSEIKLLRAIVNGDLISFNKILAVSDQEAVASPNTRLHCGGSIEGILMHIMSHINEILIKRVLRTQEAPPTVQDVEGRGTSCLRGITCGGDTALHVVAGAFEKPSQTMAVMSPINNYPSFMSPGMFGSEAAAAGAVSALSSTAVIFIYSLINVITFLFPIKRICQRFAALVANVFPPAQVLVLYLYQLTNSNTRSRSDSQPIMRANQLKIAEIIYHEDKTLLSATNYAMKETPLHCAAKAGKLGMVSLLIKFAREEGIDTLKNVLRAKNQEGETALHEAARSGYSAIVKELLDADEELSRARIQQTESTSSEARSDVVEEMMWGEDENLANMVNNNGESPLYLAVVTGRFHVINLLISSNRPISYAGPDEQTALHAAVLKQEEMITKTIHKWKPSLATTMDNEKNTPLHYAALNGNSDAVRHILSDSTETAYKKNLYYKFPVHLAAEAGNVGVIRELLRSCPDIGELLDEENRNFLHVAVENNRTGVIVLVFQQLINAKVVNARDKEGNTPLHLAVIRSDAEIFALLLRSKTANPNIRNKDGLTPLDISTSLQDRQFTYALRDLSIRNNAARADGPNQREGSEVSSAAGIDIEKESMKYENMSKSLITGAVLIASAAFVALFTVSGVYKGDNVTSSHTWINKKNVFKAFIIANILAFTRAIVSTTLLLYSALTNFHLKYRKFYFQLCMPVLYGAINLLILTFGLGGYITIAPLCEWLGIVIFVVSGIAIVWNIIWSPQFVPILLLSRYVRD